jgi:glycosyltransferase involved in cell wall biosynthesis
VLWHHSATAGVLRTWLPDCAGKLREVARPFPAERFNRPLDAGAVKARYQVGPVDPTVVFVGDLDEKYGPDLLVKAMPGILKNNKQVRLVVVGDGQLYWPLRVYSRYLLIEHAVRLPGSVTDDALAELIQAADVVCVPSRTATPWWPIQAAWAALRPVVATHNAAPTLTEHDRDSILCYPSENSLVWGVERVLYDAEMAKAIGRSGEAKLEERFGWNIVAAQVEELMEAGKSR